MWKLNKMKFISSFDLLLFPEEKTDVQALKPYVPFIESAP